MSGKYSKILTGLAVFLVALLGQSEVKIQRLTSDFQLMEKFSSVSKSEPQLSPIEIDVKGVPEGSTVNVSWSAGSKTYHYFRVMQNKTAILDFWGTNALFSRPAIWQEKIVTEDEYARFLTYQPLILATNTPLGAVRSGYYLWTFNGDKYIPKRVTTSPLSLWPRSFLPIQE